MNCANLFANDGLVVGSVSEHWCDAVGVFQPQSQFALRNRTK